MVLDLLQFPIVSSFPKRTKTIRLQVGKITIISHMNNFLDFSRLFYLGNVYYTNLHVYYSLSRLSASDFLPKLLCGFSLGIP